MKITKLARREAKGLFRVCLIGGLPDEDRVRKVVSALVNQKPRGYLAILTHFHRLLKLDIERRTARIESAIALPEDQKSTVQQRLASVYPEGLEVHFDVNGDLIGGLRVKVGSDVYDGSVAGRLKTIRAQF